MTLKVIVVTLCIILIANQLFHSVRHYCLITLLFSFKTLLLVICDLVIVPILYICRCLHFFWRMRDCFGEEHYVKFRFPSLVHYILGNGEFFSSSRKLIKYIANVCFEHWQSTHLESELKYKQNRIRETSCWPDTSSVIPPGNTRREWLCISLPCITHGLVSAIFVNNTALFFSGKKGKCLYQCVKSDYLEIPRLSFVSSTRAYLLCEGSI